MAQGSAEEKVAAFLLNWRKRLAGLNAPTQSVPLPMTRQDIADFLGLTIETVCRALSKLEQKNLIRGIGKDVLFTGLEEARVANLASI